MNWLIFSDLVEHKLEVAKELGADFMVKVNPSDNEKILAQRIHDLLGGLPEITIDCSGFQPTIRLGLEVSCAIQSTEFSLSLAMWKNFTIIHSNTK